jgi:signal transduction histidine kinase
VAFETHVDAARFSPDIETACFRITQEALTNVVRYANASHVMVQLGREGDSLILSIADNGRGFDFAAMRLRAQAGGSLGVLGMQERAALIGGALEIDSAPGRGSTVRLRCPWVLQNKENT